ncbi:MAG TPA: terminase gpA endonuclease subunit [Rhodocyclaceae bacterium]|nr:terminase gpA endonuclease subunit [Rhodocyclaceae bacterium]
MSQIREVVHFPWAEEALNKLIARCFRKLRPRKPLSILQWAEKYRILSKEETNDFPGDFDMDNTPVLRGILAACGERHVKRVIVQKSAQVGYTAGIVCSVLGYHIHWKPCVQVVMFPRAQSAKDFEAEKFSPMVRATPALAKRISGNSRTKGNSTTRKHYLGGLIKLVASNSPADVKSTSAKIRIVEEPDDTNKDVKGQGKSIAALRERGKTVRESFELIGGSPTAKNASEIEAEMRTTDQRRFYAPCHHCGESHEVEWEHVTIPGLDLSEEDLRAPDLDVRWPIREVYGRARWEDAFYTCPHCGSVWPDEDRVENIRAAARVEPHFGWVPSSNNPDPGFYCNEMQSIFEGSYTPKLAEKYLRALHLLEQGDPTEMIVFTNATRGRTWEYAGELPEEDELRERAEAYAEWSVPAMGALEVIATVDVQGYGVAVTVWAAGRGEEMWIAYWGELFGQTIVPHAGAWIELEELLSKSVRHPSGAMLRIRAVGIDCGDGNTSDAAYAFVRKHDRKDRPVLAQKGAPDDQGRVEIWTPPKPIDPNNKATKAAKFGVLIYQVGTAKAKDLILGSSKDAGRVRLTGSGPGRMHWYKDIRADFYEQLLSSMKIPSRINPRLSRWKDRTDRRHEVLDCTIYAVHLCRHLRLHLKKAWEWDVLEMHVRQADMLSDTLQSELQTSANSPATALPDAPQPAQPQEVAAPAEPSTSPAIGEDYLSRIQKLRRKQNGRR